MPTRSGRTIEIRVAAVDDLAAVSYCARLAYSKYVERMDKEPAPMNADFASLIQSEQVFIAISKSSFAGYVVIEINPNHIQLKNIAVLPAQTGKGIGKMLIEFVEQVAIDKGLKAIELYTNEVMTENLTMYPKLGYIEFERKQQAGFNRVFFRKLL